MSKESQTERTRSIYGTEEWSLPLPFFKKVNIPRNENAVGLEGNPLGATENCGGKIISGALMGQCNLPPLVYYSCL